MSNKTNKIGLGTLLKPSSDKEQILKTLSFNKLNATDI